MRNPLEPVFTVPAPPTKGVERAMCATHASDRDLFSMAEQIMPAGGPERDCTSSGLADGTRRFDYCRRFSIIV